MQKFIKFNIDTTYDDMRIIEKAIFEGDTLTMVIKVYDNGILADLTNQIVDLVLLKPDGTVVEGVQQTISNGVITAKLSEQATLAVGFVQGTLQITEDATSHLSTNLFTYMVLPSIADTVLEKSADEIQTLQDLLIAIRNNETVINNYTSLINQVFATTSSIQALADIQAYINSNLAALTTQNTNAANNIPIIQSENIKALANIAAMQSFGDVTALAQTVQNNTNKLAYMSKTAKAITSKIVNATTTKNIALVGDSITGGVNGTGFALTGDIIYGGYRTNLNGHCWANSLKTFLESKYICTVTNRGVPGLKSMDIASNLSTFIKSTDDIVIIMVGTNNRLVSTGLASLESDLTTIIIIVKPTIKK